MNYLKKLIREKHKGEDTGDNEAKSRKSSMIVLRRKQIVAVSLIVLVAVAGYLNWTFSSDSVDPDVATMYTEASKKLGEATMVSGDAQGGQQDAQGGEAGQPTSTPQAGNDYFSQAKMDRDIKRSESMEMLLELVNNPNTDSEARTNAENEVHKLASNTEIETNIENQIKAKGYANAVAFLINDPDGKASISVAVATGPEGLNKQDAAIIQEIVTTCSSLKAEHMKLVEIK